MSKKPPKNFHSLEKPLELVLKFRWLKMNSHTYSLYGDGMGESMG
jgi:hypothetical protein